MECSRCEAEVARIVLSVVPAKRGAHNQREVLWQEQAVVAEHTTRPVVMCPGTTGIDLIQISNSGSVGWVERTETRRDGASGTNDGFRFALPILRRIQTADVSSAFSRRVTPELCVLFHPPRYQRAQGKPGAGCTRGSRATKSTGVGPQVQPKHSGFPCAVVLTVSFALSPVTGLSCHRRPRQLLLLASLAPASGRQDHTTSPAAFVRSSVARIASTASHRNVRDDREPPLSRVRRAELNH